MALEPIVPGSGGFTPGYSLPTIPIQSNRVDDMGFLSSVGSALTGGAIDYFSAKDTNKKAKKLAREQMSFQERMSNTSYQRAVKDMRAAGINPMLAYMQGGASTPSGAQPSLTAPKLSEHSAKALGAVTQMQQRKLQNENIKEQNNLIKDQQELAKAQASSARGLAKQQNVIGDYYLRYPEYAPILDKAGAAGAGIKSAKDLIESIFGGKRNKWKPKSGRPTPRPWP